MRKPSRVYWHLLAPALLVLGIVACGGGEAAPTAVTPAKETPPAAAQTQTSREASSIAQQLEQDLKKLAEQWQKLEAKVTYSLRVQSGNQTQDGEMTIYLKVPNWRIDIQMEDITGIIIAKGRDVYFCEGAQRMCLRFEGDPAQLAPFLPFAADPTELPSAVEEQIINLGGATAQIQRSSRNIAGRNSACWAIEGEPAGSEKARWEICWDNTGLLLFMKLVQDSQSAIQLQATQVGRVSSQDFEPPYPIQSLPLSIPTPTR